MLLGKTGEEPEQEEAHAMEHQAPVGVVQFDFLSYP
jgi:hypothetical protein